jgi:hypothetical protein
MPNASRVMDAILAVLVVAGVLGVVFAAAYAMFGEY